MGTKVVFEGSESSEWNSKLLCYANINNEVYIEIQHEEFDTMFICLDKQTAIKLSKVLKTEISKLM